MDKKRYAMRIGNSRGRFICTECELSVEEAESPIFAKVARGWLKKCKLCSYRLDPKCKTLSCMSSERKDGKTVIMTLKEK